MINDIQEYFKNLDKEAKKLETSEDYEKEANNMDAFVNELAAFGDKADEFEFLSKEDFSLAFGNFMFETIKEAKQRADSYRAQAEILANEEAQDKLDAQMYGTYEQQVKSEYHLQIGI